MSLQPTDSQWQEIAGVIRACAMQELGLTEEQLAQEHLIDSLDSVQKLSLVVALEDHFRIAIEPNDEMSLQNTDDLVRAIARKMSHEGQATHTH